MNFDELIELLKSKQGLKNIDQIAEYLGMSRTGYLAVKSGKGGLKEKTLSKLMNGTDLDAVTITAAWMAKNANDPAVKKSWNDFLKKSAAAGLVFVILSGAMLEEGEANQGIEGSGDLPKLYIMRNTLLALFLNISELLRKKRTGICHALLSHLRPFQRLVII